MSRWLLPAFMLLATAGFVALGLWQVERREWKLALIERVEQRIHAPPVAAPGPQQWPSLTRENAEYRRVIASGRFLPGREVLVTAVTELGGGFWVIAPLQTDRGFVVLVNRGFIPSQLRDPAERTDPGATAASGRPVTVTGLLRMTEPGGGFLRANAPAEGRWYSRDVAAMTDTLQLSGTAPYFIDAQARPENGTSPNDIRAPVGGLTVVTFRNSHFTYAVTWFALAVMSAAFGIRMAMLR